MDPSEPAATSFYRFGSSALLACMLGGLLLGGLAGFLHGYSPTPLIRLNRQDCRPSVAQATDSPSPDVELDLAAGRLAALLAESQGFNLETAARIGSLERLLEELALHDVPPSRLVASLVEDMEEDEIFDLMRQLTSLDRVHLRGVEDVRDFASRLARVALAGTFEPADERAFAGSSEILFSTERELVDPARVASRVFDTGQPVVHAMIPVGDLRGEQTLVKWIRLEPPQIVALRRLSLASDQAYYSYGLRRAAALQPGRYRVEVYRVDDELTPIATGSYAIE